MQVHVGTLSSQKTKFLQVPSTGNSNNLQMPVSVRILRIPSLSIAVFND